MSQEPSEASIGWCEQQVEEELPQLRIALGSAQLPPDADPTRPSPQDVRERLAELSDRFNGAKAVNLRREPVTAAYRVFFRHIGLDPDVVRTPIEAAVLERMLDGGFLTRCLLADVLLIALLDTGVPVWALDAGTVIGGVGVRTSRPGESPGDGPGAERAGVGPDVGQVGAALDSGRAATARDSGLAGAGPDSGLAGAGPDSGLAGAGPDSGPAGAGPLVVADDRSALALLFAEPARSHRPKAGTRKLLLYSLQVAGVPWMAVEESLWISRSALEAASA